MKENVWVMDRLIFNIIIINHNYRLLISRLSTTWALTGNWYS